MNIGQRIITHTTTLENCLAESMGSKINAFFMAMQFHCKVYIPQKIQNRQSQEALFITASN